MAKHNCTAYGYYSRKIMDALTVILLVNLFDVTCAREAPTHMMRGVTIRNWPFVDLIDNKYEGFAIDLMNEIKEIAGFDYRLYLSPDGKYGTVHDNTINGMIGEVYRNRADFAIADITVTDVRRRFVDFTEPFMTVGVTALIRKSLAANISSFADLANQSRVAYGTYRSGSTYNFFAHSADPTLQRMYSFMARNPWALVNNAREGVDRVNATKYAFIVESSFSEFLTGMYCDLTFIEDRQRTLPRDYAIAVAKDSPLRDQINAAIRRLKSSGKIEELRKRYWKTNCKADVEWINEGYEASPAVGFGSGLTGYAAIASLVSVWYRFRFNG